MLAAGEFDVVAIGGAVDGGVDVDCVGRETV